MTREMEEMASRFIDHKLTRQRKKVLEVLLENKQEHLNAEEIYQLLQKKDSSIGMATVYRTLELLEELELVHKSNFGDGCSRYELALSKDEGHHHHHLICLTCNKISEVEEDLLVQLEEVITDKNKFKIVDHRVKFYGYCVECQTSSGE